MATIQGDGSVAYEFGGEKQLANAEAFKAILKHEGVPYTTGVGPRISLVYVGVAHAHSVQRLVQQWYEAMHVVHKEVWSAR